MDDCLGNIVLPPAGFTDVQYDEMYKGSVLHLYKAFPCIIDFAGTTKLFKMTCFIFLQDAINSATSITQTLSGELASGQRKLLAMAAAGANSKAGNPLVTQLSNGPLAHLHEMVCSLSLFLSPPPPPTPRK